MRPKEEAVEIGHRSLSRIGYRIFATRGTAEALKAGGGERPMRSIRSSRSPTNLMDLIRGHKIDAKHAASGEQTVPGWIRYPQKCHRDRRQCAYGHRCEAKALITSLENTDIKKLALIDIARI